MQTTTTITNNINENPNASQPAEDASTKDSAKVTNEIKTLLESVPTVPSTISAQIAFDTRNQTFLSSVPYYWGSSQDGQEQSGEVGRPEIYLFDSFGKPVKDGSTMIDLSTLMQEGGSLHNDKDDDGSSFPFGKRKESELKSLGDSLSILRFLRGNKSKRLEISPSGLTLKYHKTSGSSKDKKADNQGEEEDLVLTNMAFYTGLHLWEIIAPICCNSMQFGVFNPVTRQDFMASFKTTTPRTITVCLDLNESEVKFWLNDRRNSTKNIKLPPGGPWVPCVKISQEKNKLILNPFAREPSDFYERDFDKKFTLRKWLMPHLFNMVCVTGLAISQSADQAGKQLKDLKLSQTDIKKCILSLPTSDKKDSFAFFQFHHHDPMCDLIKRLKALEKDKGYKVYQAHEIASWFELTDLPQEVQPPFNIIKEHIPIPKATQSSAISSITDAFAKLVQNKDYPTPSKSSYKEDIQIIQQPFSDKVLLKGANFVHTLARDAQTNQFDFLQANLSQAPTKLSHPITLKIESKVIQSFFTLMNWSAILKDGNELVNAFVQTFFQEMAKSAIKLSEKYVMIKTPIDQTKHFLDLAILHTRSQLDRLKRQYQNAQTVISTQVGLTRVIKAEQPLEALVGAPFFLEPSSLSVDDTYIILSILIDLQEQLWAHAKTQRIHQDVNTFVNTVSRPWSAFNRLGSFIGWGSVRTEHIIRELADEGFFYRENTTVSQFENMGIEIPDVGERFLTDQAYLKEYLGEGNRRINSQVTENVPMYKTLNYIGAKFSKNSSILDIIASQNSDMTLTGYDHGTIHLNLVSLRLSLRKSVNMFDSDKKSKLKKNAVIMEKLFQRYQQFEDYQKSLNRKSEQFTFLKGKAPIGTAGSGALTQTHLEDFMQAKKLKALEVMKKEAVASYKASSGPQIKNKFTKKPKPKSSAKQAQKNSYDEAVVADEGFLGGLFGEEPTFIPAAGTEVGIKQPLQNFKQDECKVLGYILLTKPITINARDPITVGCVFYSAKTQKYYLRVKKLTWFVNILQNLVSIESVSGRLYNKINGKHILTAGDMEQLNLEILNHQESIHDLYSIFMRTQVLKKDWPRKDYKFMVLEEFADAELEIEDCNRVIDFTKTAYTVQDSDSIHLLVEKAGGKTNLVCYKVVDDHKAYDDKNLITPIYLDLGKELELEKVPERIFQVDDKLVLVGKDFFQVLRQNDYFFEQDEKLCMPVKSTQNVGIVNLTPEQYIYNRENLKNFLDESTVPKQDWYLVINEHKQFQRYQLTEAFETYKKKEVLTEKQEDKRQEIELDSVPASDIAQISSLLESETIGSFALDNAHSVLTSSGRDQKSKLPLTHNWTLVNDVSKPEFECYLKKDAHLKQIDLEFCFKRKNNSGDLKINQPSTPKDESAGEDNSNPTQRLQLVVEEFTGAQMNDTVHSNILTSPDNQVFCSNYPQPEFIMRLQSKRSFVVSQFVVRSLENRIYKGIPISHGLIFASESLEELKNTKQFTKMNDKELTNWFKERYQGEFKDIPALPNEPIAYFNLEDKTELIIDSHYLTRPVKFIKFIPTAFRKRPINFASKAFNANQVEIQFFGVNGFEVTNASLEDSKKASLELDFKANVVSQDARIGGIEKLQLTKVRGPKANQENLPINALNIINQQGMIAVGSATLGVKGEISDKIKSIKVCISETPDPNWQLTGVSLSIKAYSDSSVSFTNDQLKAIKPKLRSCLLDIQQFPNLLGKLITIAQNSEESNERRVAALSCINVFLKNNTINKSFAQFIELFKKQTVVEKVISTETYLEQSPQFQKIAHQYLEMIGLFKGGSNEQMAEAIVLKNIPQLLKKTLSLDKLKSLFDLIPLCSHSFRTKVYSDLLHILEDQLFAIDLPMYHTEEYIMLRSKLGINSFPYDEDNFQQTDKQIEVSSAQSQLMPCRFEVQKYNTFYNYNVDFCSNAVSINKVKLVFQQDKESIYKISVFITSPNPFTGTEETIYRRIFDENWYFQVCENAHKQEVQQYFNQGNNEDQGGQKPLDSSSITIEFPSPFIGRFLKIQVDLLDSFKSVHKSQSPTGIFIRPEFYGTKHSPINHNEAETKKHYIYAPQPQNLLLKITYPNNSTYNYYTIPGDQLSQLNKALAVTCNEEDIDVAAANTPKEAQKLEDTKSEEVVDAEAASKQLKEEREALRQMIRKGASSKNQIRTKIAEIVKHHKKSVKEENGKLSLRYLLNLANFISGSILQGVKTNNEIKAQLENQTLFKQIFLRFTVYDEKANFKNVIKLQDLILENINDKVSLIGDIINEFVMCSPKEGQLYNHRNILEFINGQQISDIEQLLEKVLPGLVAKKADKEVDQQTISEILQGLQNKGSSEKGSIQPLLSLLTIVDDYVGKAKKQEKGGTLQQLSIDLYLAFLLQIYDNNPIMQDPANSQGQLAFKYSLQILLQLSDYTKTIPQYPLTKVLLMSLLRQSQDKELAGITKQVVSALAKVDTESMSNLTQGLLQWYKDKEHIAVYSKIMSASNSSGMFYKHLFLVFDLHMLVVQVKSDTNKESNDANESYSQLSLLIEDLLVMLVNEQDSEGYEITFSEVWIQILKTLNYQQKSVPSVYSVEKFTKSFFSLNEVLQETLYPEFHECLQTGLDKTNPQIIIKLLGSFLKIGPKKNLKLTYCFCDGLLNILQTGKRKFQSQTAVHASLKDSQQVADYTEIFVTFLNDHLNYGVYSGIVGASHEDIMKLDIAVQLSSYILAIQVKEKSFEKFISCSSIDASKKEKLLTSLIQWLILNYNRYKIKSAPAGARIAQISSNLEQLLDGIAQSDQAVSLCLPMLMRNILQADFKLRQMVTEQKINTSRAVDIQKTVNQLFLTLFNQWVKTDTVAKKFLTELNGFDFLLDRLFSKLLDIDSKDQGSIVKEPSAQGSPEDDPFDQKPTQAFLTQNSTDEDFIVNLAMQKVALLKKESSAMSGVKDANLKGTSSANNNQSKKLKKKEEKPAKIEQDNSQKDLDQQLMIDDFGKDIKLIWSSDKQESVKSTYLHTQWHKFKNGTKNRLYHYVINDKQFSYEYVLKFDLEKVVMMNEIQMGLVYNWSTYDQDSNTEPLSIIVEGGREQDQPEWKVLLHACKDDGFSMNSMTLYGYNFVDMSKKISSNASLEQMITQIGAKEARYLTFKFRKPIISCSDTSLYLPQASKTKSYGLSFVSVMGNMIVPRETIYNYLIDTQKENSLEILSKFFSNEFTEAFEMISEQESIIEKIKNAFDKLVLLMSTKGALIKPIFLALCSKNSTLGDWIMTNRLISMDPAYIKKEQIQFLGDIVSSSKELQMDKVLKLLAFIIEQINKVASGELKLTPEQQKLLKWYIKLFNTKLRECAFVKQSDQQVEPIILGFKDKDLDNVIQLMSSCGDPNQSKFFNALTEFALILLLPPKPMENKTIPAIEYVEKLLQGEQDLQNLLFCSIMASTDEKVIGHILRLGKIEQIIEAMQQDANKDKFFQYAQVLHNCSKQPLFRDQQRLTLSHTLYNFLKKGQNDRHLLRKDLTDPTIFLLMTTMRDLILGDATLIETFSSILKEDMVDASAKNDIAFINKVIVPVLKAEEMVPITISIVEEEALKKGKPKLHSIYATGETAGQGQDGTFILRTDLLNKQQKTKFTEKFKEIAKDKVESFQKLQDGKWELIFEDKAHQNQNPAKFRSFVKAVSNRQNVIVLVKGKVLEQPVIYGGFSHKPFPVLGDTWNHEFDYQIPYSEANFVFCYDQTKELHYTMLHNKCFGYIYTDYEEGGALSVSGDFFLVSWSYEFQNSCGNLYDMKCIEDPNSISAYNNITIENIEIWSCDTAKKSDRGEAGSKVMSELKKNPLYKSLSPFNFFRQNLVFEVSKSMTLSHIAKEIIGKNQVFIKYPTDEVISGVTPINEQISGHSLITDLVVLKKAVPKQEDGGKLFQIKEEAEEVLPAIAKIQPILAQFEAKGGIFDLIKAAKSAASQYKSEKLREIWCLWLNEIESFSQLPSFFTKFCQDATKEAIIYNLIEGTYDIKPDDNGAIDPASPDNVRFIQSQEDLHIDMAKYSYKIVSEVFESHESAELRDKCLTNGTFERFVERIGQLSSEKKRTKIQKKQVDETIKTPEKKSKKGQLEKGDKKKHGDKKDQKRKGVGYTTGVGVTWNVSEYIKSKEAKSQQAANIVNILKNMIKSKDWEAPEQIKNMLLESALLPTLEAAFRSGSLLEIAKEYELNMSYLGFVQEIANHPTLISLLLDIGEDYEPRQKEPVYLLLSKLNDLGSIFLNCLSEESKKSTDEEQMKPRKLAEEIQLTNNIVQTKISESKSQIAKESLMEILSLPLSQAYWKLLSPMRFDYMSMKNSSGSYNHVYQGDLYKHTNPPVTKLVRLAQEIADLSNSLPCDYTDAIFCRVDKERVDMMKCLIMGASGTPYAHGAFIYDLLFENTYPNTPPKCQLVTTGGGTVRFNPNLYNNGKVCLSLLGTWRGQSTENWDAKVSTILQVLLSVQAIIMSNEVYFNEPGYEHEQGTPEGERKNEGYSNIVRYCNVKFAMIEAIKNPPAGFEKIIRSSFYLKKNEILKEVKEWVDRAKKTEATYTGLVYDHNYTWAPQISPEGKYAEMMEAIYKELKETLEGLPSPFEDEGKVVERKFSFHEEEKKTTDEPANKKVKLEDIDVSYDAPIDKHEAININDDKVKDRWSRYIGAMGIEAVAKQAESRILICGLGAIGVEIAKNIVLAGCKELILFDDIQPIADELSGQFFVTSKELDAYDYTKTRAHYSKDKLQQLNFYVKVTVLESSQDIPDFIEKQGDLKAVVLTDLFQFNSEKQKTINNMCRKTKSAFITAYNNGLFGKVFTDFGAEFTVIDKDGEELQEVMIKNIAYDEEKDATIVTLLEGFKHKYEDNDHAAFKEVLGMKKIEDNEKSINDVTVSVKVINPSSFIISEDARNYTPYEGNGIAKQVKVPRKHEFKSLEEIDKLDNDEISNLFDPNLLISDFEKLDNKKIIHYIYKKILELQDEDYYENDPLIATEHLVKKVVELLPEADQKKVANLAFIFSATQKFTFPPIAAFLGGVVSQEIVKAITQKYTPIKQLFYFDCIELYPAQDTTQLDASAKKALFKYVEEEQGRYMGLKMCLGEDLVDEIHNCQVFMIGAGAIGCELLKNYAMLGLGTGSDGGIIVTDPDVIEVSNLNRQFLFREKHLRKPKSQTAAAAAIQMNPDLKNKIEARLDKIHDGTSHIYTEEFFSDQSIVTNALDNVQARLYIDGKCVNARTPLLDSGTLGPKGHVQVVLPEHRTESYASQRDPDENGGEIPHCTLKMFPEETLHCVEWAKDKFGNIFSLQPQSFNKLIVEEKDRPVNYADQQEKAALKKIIKMVEKKPENFDDCLRMARLRFQKHFFNDVKQLLHVYPLDKQTKEGRPFWSLPKRPPTPVEFDPKVEMHQNVIAAFSCLLAKIYGVKIPFEKPRSKEAKMEMAEKASKFEVPAFIPNDQKASQIESQVDKEKSGKTEEAPADEDNQMIMGGGADSEVQQLMAKFDSIIAPLRVSQALKLEVEEFEKDNDDNFHIDFIHAMANVRAANYKLDEMDWITVKIKAGRIVPALATTTAAIAALQTIELIKYLKDVKLVEYRNSFLNLAVPSLMMSEPGPAAKTILGSGDSKQEVTLWDRWEYEASSYKVTLLKLVDYLEETYKLSVRDIFYGSIPLFMYALQQGKSEEQRRQVLNKSPIIELTHPGVKDHSSVEFIDLTVTFVDPNANKASDGSELINTESSHEKVLEGVPQVRVVFEVDEEDVETAALDKYSNPNYMEEVD